MRSWLVPTVLAVTLIWFVVGMTTGPGWGAASGHAILAAHLERTAAAPLHGVAAGLFALLPIGEVGTRVALLDALLAALTCAGVVAAARALLPKDPIAGVAGALLLALAPPFRTALGPDLMAACGVVWAIAFAAEHARAASTRRMAGALAAALLVIGSAPYLGATLAILVTVWLARTGAPRDRLAAGIGALGLAIVLLWLHALGPLPGLDVDLAAIVGATGGAAVLVGAGLLGAAFGAATGLPGARWLALVIALVLAHAIAIEPAPSPLLALLAIATSVIAAAVVRATGGERRTAIALGAGVPLVLLALVTGATITVDDPAGAPARLATDVIGELPAGPGVVVATRGTTWSAIGYEQRVAGARPDLELAPPVAPNISDGIVADALRARWIAGSDVPAIGRLDPRRALPRGRGFELRGTAPDIAVAPIAPAHYATARGAEEATLLAISRAGYEAGLGRLDAAARAAGLTDRFRAADLAILATARVTAARPPLFALVPNLDDAPPGRWLAELFGDDLAWVAGMDAPVAPASKARRLHARWRLLLGGAITRDDPEIAALGPRAIAATDTLLATLRGDR